jgi:hypothetical protein
MSKSLTTNSPVTRRRGRTLRQLRYSIGVVASLLVGAMGLLVGAPSAFAVRVGDAPGGGTSSTPTTTVVHSGMLGWQITLIAIGAAVVAALATALVLRMGSRRSLSHATA